MKEIISNQDKSTDLLIVSRRVQKTTKKETREKEKGNLSDVPDTASLIAKRFLQNMFTNIRVSDSMQMMSVLCEIIYVVWDECYFITFKKINYTYGKSLKMLRVLKTPLLLHFLYLIAKVVGRTSCPNYFQYGFDEITNKTIGLVDIPSPPKGIILHLRIELSLSTVLPTQYVGSLKLAKPKTEAVEDIKRGNALKYKIHFPLPHPIPLLTGLWFNNQLMCSGLRANGPVYTVIVFDHTLCPSGTISPGSTCRPRLNAAIAKSVDVDRRPRITFEPNSEECGFVSKEKKTNLLVAGGAKTYPGQWPWLVAIFVMKHNLEFQCVGSLVTNRHIVTAAHCLEYYGEYLPTETLLVGVGHYHLRKWRGNDTMQIEVADYKLSPGYKKSDNADSDLAVLILRDRVEYSDRVKPICLWSGSSDLELVVGQVGYVVGWGRDEFGNLTSDEPRQTKIPIVSQKHCMQSSDIFSSLISNRTFCAGFKDGSGPCNGDSGSGFMIYDRITDRYYLRGIVSRSLNGAYQPCDLMQYVIYVDVAKHVNWIKKQISA